MHALLVPIRDDDGDAAAGRPDRGLRRRSSASTASTTAGIWFDHVRVPRDEPARPLRATVAEDGTYFSPIENPTKRFFTMLGTLIQGRVSVGGAAISASKVALTIAVRHALRAAPVRRARASEEALLLDYRTHQRRLLPAAGQDLRAALRPGAARRRAARGVHRRRHDADRERRELETLAAGRQGGRHLARDATRSRSCREACGGAGYLRANRFAALKADTDVFTTFEGDNTVLLQLAAKNLLTDYKDAVRRARPARDGAVRRRPGARARWPSARALREARRLADDCARPRRRRPTCSTARPSSSCSAGATSTCSGRGAAPEGRHRRRPRPVRRARRLPGPRASRRRARGSTSWSWRRSPTRSSAARTRHTPLLDKRLRPVRAGARSRPSAAGYQEHGRLSVDALEGGHQGRQHALRRAAPARARAGRRVRRAGDGARRRRVVADAEERVPA